MLEIEITESAIIDYFDQAIDKIDELRQLGFAVSMDDFGSGISSLKRLKDIKVDTLKIDREFLTDTLHAREGIAIIENVIRMGKQLNLVIVAEGVEMQEQVELLKNLGCDIAQGYYFARPMEAEDLIKMLAN